LIESTPRCDVGDKYNFGVNKKDYSIIADSSRRLGTGILIGTPRLESRATATKQKPDSISNREYIAVFQFGFCSAAHPSNQEPAPALKRMFTGDAFSGALKRMFTGDAFSGALKRSSSA
jgi:hypothetical protein